MTIHPESAFDYDPYGVVLRQYTTGPEPYLTTQHQRDTETGLDYRGARFYDAEVGRFLSVDPLAVKYPMLTTYSFVGGMVTMAVDPDGRQIIPFYNFNSNWKAVHDHLIEKNNFYQNNLAPFQGPQGTIDLYLMSAPLNLTKYAETKWWNDNLTEITSNDNANLGEIGIAVTMIHESVHANLGLEHIDSADHLDAFAASHADQLAAIKQANDSFGWKLSDSDMKDLSYLGYLINSTRQPNEYLKSYLMGNVGITKVETEEEQALNQSELDRWKNNVEKLIHTGQ
jgi:RHS repeat-associated protein